MKISPVAILSLAILAEISLPASAASSVGGVFIDYVTVGNVGNSATTAGWGSVAHEYKIAKYETTVGQYCEFLNSVAKSDPYQLYTSYMSKYPVWGITRSGVSGNYSYSLIGRCDNKPITYVSWFDAARFCNWLHNGQGSGSTETGAYTLEGAMSGIYTKNAGAITWIPTYDEWYKAAYYDPAKDGTGGYWPYATQSNTLAGNTVGVPNSANYFDGDYVDYYGIGFTDVGAYGENSNSFYGTSDQGGNVAEWHNTVMSGTPGYAGGSRRNGGISLQAGSKGWSDPWNSFSDVGFRVASVPEPSCFVLTLLASGMCATRRKR
jgi:formylglycine-generating enzyme required for sulfatase activity